jgi:hypothetical protein
MVKTFAEALISAEADAAGGAQSLGGENQSVLGAKKHHGACAGEAHPLR